MLRSLGLRVAESVPCLVSSLFRKSREARIAVFASENLLTY